MNLKYAIIGTGALGGYYGGKLCQHGHEVHFLYHSEYDYVKTHGLQVDSVNGDFHLNNMNIYSSTSQMPPCDVVLVAMKSTQNDQLHTMLPPLLHAGSVIILVQNGLGLEQELEKAIPQNPIGGAMAFICASRIAPGHICHADYGALTVSYLHNHINPDIAYQIKQDFEESGVPFTQGDDLNLFRWRKLVWNIPYNGLTVVLHTTTDCLMKDPASRALVTDLMQEVVNGAKACGADIGDEFVQRMLDNTDHMKPYAPSMRLDYDHHRPMEIKAIYSNPVAIAKAAGCHLHKVEMLEQQLLFIEENEIRHGQERE